MPASASAGSRLLPHPGTAGRLCQGSAARPAPKVLLTGSGRRPDNDTEPAPRLYPPSPLKHPVPIEDDAQLAA
jgi:hypothetical protein